MSARVVTPDVHSHATVRAYLVGGALAAPFVANPLPSNAWALVVVVPLALHVLRFGIARPSVTPLAVLIGFIAMQHFAHLLMGPTPFWKDVLRDIVMALGAVAIVLTTDMRRSLRLLDGFFSVVVLVAAVSAALGTAKFAMLGFGILVPFLVDTCGVAYPQGSVLCGDYNLYGLLLIVGGLGIVRHLAERPTCWAVTALAVIVIALMLTGSRRAILCAPLILVYWIFLAHRAQALRTTFPFLALILAIAMGTAALPGFDLPKKDVPAIAGRSDVPDVASRRDFVIRDNSVGALTTTFTAEEGYGLGSRTERWQLAWTLIQRDWTRGIGFRYHDVFSCRFVACKHIDYPHAPILSAWIAGGLQGLVIALAFYGLLAWLMWRAGWAGLTTGATPVMLAVLPFTVISGDTVLSIPQLIVAALLVQSAGSDAESIAVRVV